MTIPELALWLGSSSEDDAGGSGALGGAQHAQHAQDAAAAKNAALQLARLQRGDVATFEALFFEHAAPLRRFVLSLVRATSAPSAHAEEIIQEVFAQFWEKRESLHVKSTLRAYLYAAVRGRALMVLRGERVREAYSERTGVEDIVVIPAPVPDALARLETEELTRAIADSLACLTPRVREAAELKWFSRLTHAEIAAVMGTSPATVNNQLTTALRTLRERLAPYFDK